MRYKKKNTPTIFVMFFIEICSDFDILIRFHLYLLRKLLPWQQLLLPEKLLPRAATLEETSSAEEAAIAEENTPAERAAPMEEPFIVEEAAPVDEWEFSLNIRRRPLIFYDYKAFFE